LLTQTQTLFVPAIISLVIFLVLSFVIVPVWRRYRSRYGQYLPLDTISSSTTSLRDRITERLARMMAASPLARGGGSRTSVDSHRAIDLEDGEELDDIDQATWRAIERHVGEALHDTDRRLSRDLEEVFRDDSDDSDDSDL
jgi:hypothetical protein